MTKRVLATVASELNVGLHTVVEHLVKKGFDIQDKPNAKITDDMYNELLREFSKDMAEKGKADQLVIGARPLGKKDALPEKPAIAFSRDEFKKTISLRGEPAKPQEEKQPELIERVVPRPVVVGKIDLEPKPKPKKEEAPVVETPVEPPAPEPPVEIVVQQPAEPEIIAAPEEEPQSAEIETVRAETPELRGLKILGKIDTEKLKSDRTKSKEKEQRDREQREKDRPARDPNQQQQPPQERQPSAGGSAAADAENRRRRRKRHKVTPPPGENRPAGQGQRPGAKPAPRREEAKEISKKEIEDKIKATMARLQKGGGKRRQRLRRDNRDRLREKQEMMELEQSSDKLQVTEFISVSELASLMNVSPAEVITVCLNLGVVVSINQRLDAEVIELVATEFGHEVEFISAEDQTTDEEEIVDDPEDMEPRAPIVTVMGHVDHGKTSLLDHIRKANVVAGEAGGITQHIGAYEVVVNDKKITFLDTPGHEAFTAMRARGAKVTDIAIIIVAADDGVMPQTREAISHAQAAGVPMVFAINKVDKPGANPEKIKEELASMNFLVEDWGGKYQSQDISAKTGKNIENLLEKILLEAEMLDLKANPNRPAVGTVLEASLEKGRGYVTKILVQTGSLEIGDAMVAGESSGKVKAMFNERGQRIKTAGPSTPVLVLGLDGAPQAGERFKVVENDQEARQLAARRAQISREQATRARKRISLDEIGRRLALGTFKELNIIIKGDVDGSIEALADSLLKQTQVTVQVNVIHKAVGQIVESDVLLASASDAIIIGFQVRPSANARKLAEKEGVEIKLYSIIYEAIEEVKAAIEGMLEPTKEEKIVANVTIREVYKISKVGTVAGCYVDEGKLTKNTFIRLIRDGIVIFPTREGIQGELSSLKRFKDDVKEVRAGMECGLTIKNFNDIKVGDVIEGYEITETKQKLA